MARYRKIETRIWNDEKFRDLSDHAKLAFFFLLTHPHMTSIGAMRATIRGLASEIGWTEKAFREAFGEAFRKGMCEYDEKACFVGLPNFLKYNGPESPNVVKSWSESLDLIPECVLKVRLITRVKAFTEGLTKAFAEALPEAFRKGMPNQEQEPEQEPEQEQDGREPREKFTPPTVDQVREYCQERGNSVDPERFVNHYTSNGWKVGKAAMKDWRASVRTWEKNEFNGNGKHDSSDPRGTATVAAEYKKMRGV